MLPFIEAALKNPEKTAIIDQTGTFTYAQVLEAAIAFAQQILAGQPDLMEKRVAYMVPPGFDYVRVQWGIWLAGGIAVPLCIDHPANALEYTLTDAAVELVVAGPAYEHKLRRLSKKLGCQFNSLSSYVIHGSNPSKLPSLPPERRAMILYTSGTTNQPKGVVSTHKNLRSQINVLLKAWEWSDQDHILCVLPLHHVHGIINIVNCALWSGACCTFLSPFTVEGVFHIFRQGQVNVFMAVPTIYYKLIAFYDVQSPETRENISQKLRAFRLMVSGSAALPVSVMQRWEEISGHRLLERYGMTEIGMALSNSYRRERIPGHVGLPLPGMAIRLRNEEGQTPEALEAGEIQVRGDSVFLEYWQQPQATAEAFTEDGWFKTGDIAQLDPQKGYRILGRNSVDIIKSGGYKISALEIEEVLRRHPAIDDCAVVGVPDEEWGEIVAAALIAPTDPPDIEELKAWLKTYLPAYKTPRQYRILPVLPRNAMGKVTKKSVVRIFTNAEADER